MTFEEALKLVGLAEGAYTNDPDDSGGETICGISRKNNPDSKIWEMIDTWKSRGTTDAKALDKTARTNPEFMSMVEAIYRGKYWNACHCDKIHELYRYPMFSCAVNCGPSVAIALLQKALGIKTDGIYGIKTARAVYESIPTETLERFYNAWSEYYDKIVQKNPTNAKYLKGWKNRIANVKRDNH